MKLVVTLGMLAGLGCATTSEPATNSAVTTRQGPPLTRATSEASAVPAPYFPLPKALAKDPRSLKFTTIDLNVVKPERVTWDNGLTLYLIQDRTVPLVSLSALVS